jgi:hypothetical protein
MFSIASILRMQLAMSLLPLSLAATSTCTGQDAAVATGAFSLQAEGDDRWLKGNMHTHSHWSDGDDYPEMIANWYREKGYQFLVFTDHNTLLQNERWVEIDKTKGGRPAFDALKAAFPSDWISTRTMDNREEVRLKTFDEIFNRLAVPQEYLLIQGEEISDKYKSAPIHMCATNTLELLPPIGGDSVVDVMQRNIDAARARRERTGVKTLVHLNHPNFGYAVTAEDLMKVVGENFFEVYNGHPSVHNLGDNLHASTERMWDIVNTFRLAELKLPIMYGLATDDGHNYFEKQPGKGAQPGRGWVMVLAKTLTPDALVDSLEAGHFYSTSGVTLNSVTFDGKKLEVRVQPSEGVTYRIDFLGTRRGFDAESQPADANPEKAARLTRRYSSEVGAVLKSVDGPTAVYECDGSELYVRALVTASTPHPNPSEPGEFERAWVQPVIPTAK